MQDKLPYVFRHNGFILPVIDSGQFDCFKSPAFVFSQITPAFSTCSQNFSSVSFSVVDSILLSVLSLTVVISTVVGSASVVTEVGAGVGVAFVTFITVYGGSVFTTSTNRRQIMNVKVKINKKNVLWVWTVIIIH